MRETGNEGPEFEGDVEESVLRAGVFDHMIIVVQIMIDWEEG